MISQVKVYLFVMVLFIVACGDSNSTVNTEKDSSGVEQKKMNESNAVDTFKVLSSITRAEVQRVMGLWKLYKTTAINSYDKTPYETIETDNVYLEFKPDGTFQIEGHRYILNRFQSGYYTIPIVTTDSSYYCPLLFTAFFTDGTGKDGFFYYRFNVINGTRFLEIKSIEENKDYAFMKQ